MNDNTGECECGHRGYEHDRGYECNVEDCGCVEFKSHTNPQDKAD